MTSRIFGENTVLLTSEEVERLSNEPRKVFYQYESDATLEPSQNMSPERVAQTVTALRAAFDAELARDPDFSVATLKQRLRSDPATDCFATQHPRIFDTVLSKFSGPKDIELVLHMVRFRTAVDKGLLTENQAKATLNELLIGHYKRPEGTDREKWQTSALSARSWREASWALTRPPSLTCSALLLLLLLPLQLINKI